MIRTFLCYEYVASLELHALNQPVSNVSMVVD